MSLPIEKNFIKYTVYIENKSKKKTKKRNTHTQKTIRTNQQVQAMASLL